MTGLETKPYLLNNLMNQRPISQIASYQEEAKSEDSGPIVINTKTKEFEGGNSSDESNENNRKDSIFDIIQTRKAVHQRR